MEGDSASLAELLAILSRIGGFELRQDLAVTGSVNQRGEVQAIGGVNQKIEGFFDLCRLEGLTGKQGVLIPARNLPQLMLRKDLIAEARRGRFHVWGVATIEEGLETLTGETAGKPDAKGRYPETSIFGRVDRELTRLAEEGVRFGRPSKSEKTSKS